MLYKLNSECLQHADETRKRLNNKLHNEQEMNDAVVNLFFFHFMDNYCPVRMFDIDKICISPLKMFPVTCNVASVSNEIL